MQGIVRMLKQFRKVILLGMVLALVMALLPFGVLAYSNPSAVHGWGKALQGKHSGPVVLDETDEDETEPPEVDEDEDLDEDEDPDEDEDLPDIEDPGEISGTQTITNVIVLRGPVTALPAGDVLSGTWTISGQAVQVTAQTHLSARAGRVAVGDWAQARCQRDEGGLVALSISVMHASANKMARVVGKIEQFDPTWVVAGVSISVTAQTHIVGTPAVGALADVHGMISEDGFFVAKLIKVRGTKNMKGALPWGQAKKMTPVPEEGDATVEGGAKQGKGHGKGKGK